PFPMFEVFDLPEHDVTCPKRYGSTAPTHALTRLNNEFVLKQARFLAERILRDAGVDAAAEVERAYAIALSRSPSADEKRVTIEFLERQRRFHEGKPDAELAALADFPPARVTFHEFA